MSAKHPESDWLNQISVSHKQKTWVSEPSHCLLLWCRKTIGLDKQRDTHDVRIYVRKSVHRAKNAPTHTNGMYITPVASSFALFLNPFFEISYVSTVQKQASG